MNTNYKEHNTAMSNTHYWLFKSEPSVFSIYDLSKSQNQSTSWEGVRNYQARNFLRDEIKLNDLIFFYHSQKDPVGIAGIAKIIKEGYIDENAFNKEHRYYDPKSSKDNPSWFQVDIQLVEIFDKVITLQEIKKIDTLKDMVLLKRGSRLSIQPVATYEWDCIINYKNSLPSI